jgi:hypothetical protein
MRSQESEARKALLALRAREKGHTGLALRARGMPAEPRASRSGASSVKVAGQPG